MPVHDLLSRRNLIVGSALAASGLVLSSQTSRDASAQSLTPTPSCLDAGDVTPEQTEGPYYTPRSPERADFVEQGTAGRILELQGQVLTRSCRPVPRAVLDLWHADENGNYDNEGFRYRGHVLAGADGSYRFRTVVPGLYPGRTRHYHVKVGAQPGRLLTTQLYFPDEARNRSDNIFAAALSMRVAEGNRGLAARFDFVLDMA